MDTVAATELRITRTYAATAEKVFDAWISTEALKRWFAPSGEFQTSEVAVDAPVGGRYRIVMRSPDGEMHRVGGVYREFTPPRKLVFTWAWESTPECGHHEKGWNGCLDRLPKILMA